MSLLCLACVGSMTIDDFCFMTKRAFIIRYFWWKLQYPATLMPTQSHYRDVAVIILFFEYLTLNVYDRRLKSKDSSTQYTRAQIIHHVYNVRFCLDTSTNNWVMISRADTILYTP